MRVHPFKNQYRDHDFTSIADTIKEYFSVDKAKRLTSKTVIRYIVSTNQKDRVAGRMLYLADTISDFAD